MSRETPLQAPARIPPVSHVALSRKLKLQQLVVIARVVDAGSLMRAASDLGMTQPGVTKALHEVETFLAAPLFERTNRGVVPTELGRLVGRRAKAVLAELRHLTEEINAVREGTSGHVVVGATTSASARLLPLTLARLKEEAPHLLLTVRDGNTMQLLPALATGDLDIVVTRLPELAGAAAHGFPLRHEELYRESLCIVAGARQPLNLPARPGWADLGRLPWLFPLPESPGRQFVEGVFSAAGLELPANRIETTSMFANLNLLMALPCLAIMPMAAVRPFVEAGLLVMLEGPAPGDFGAIGFSVRADREVSPACYRLIMALRTSAAEVRAEGMA